MLTEVTGIWKINKVIINKNHGTVHLNRKTVLKVIKNLKITKINNKGK